MNTHDMHMPIRLNGQEVRHRAAEMAVVGGGPASTDLGSRNAREHILWLAEQTGIPVGTIHNATRDHSPQTISLLKVYELAAVLRRDDEDVRDTVEAITAKDDEKPEPKPDPKKDERPRDPAAPPRRKNGKDNHRGPRRDAELRQAS